ncbi:MAG: magnesium transporter CorA, partial [Caldimonas sp.]
MAVALRVFHIFGDRFAELEALPDKLPESGYVWVASTRAALEESIVDIQGALQRWTGAQLFDLHVVNLLNRQLPSNFDYTSAYDILVFRRLAAGIVPEKNGNGNGEAAPPPPGPQPEQSIEVLIDTSAVGFTVFDRVLLTVHPIDCLVREFFAARL